MQLIQGDSAVSATFKKRIGVVTARFNFEVTEKLEQGALELLYARGFKDDQILLVRVPGAFEIPLAVKKLLSKPDVIGCVALGAVIRGDTSHYDYVCNAVETGCTQLALDFQKPVGFGILTTENDEQAHARAGGAHGNKGADAAQVVIEMANLMSTLEGR